MLDLVAILTRAAHVYSDDCARITTLRETARKGVL